jgi:carboxypeptidase Q
MLALAVLALSSMTALAATPASSSSTEAVDLEMVTRIRQEGFHNSQVMQTLSELTDHIGPRLTGSPNMKKANEWTRDQLGKWGLQNAHLEAWGPFGRGWVNDASLVRLVEPYPATLIALPEAWTPGTNGVLRGKAVYAKLENKEDLEKYKGKLAGAIVLLGEMREVKPHDKAEMERYDDKELEEIYQYQGPGPGRRYQRPPREEIIRRIRFARELTRFLIDEKVAAVIRPSRGDGGTIFVQGTRAYQPNQPAGVPSVVMAIEHYGRIYRLLERDVPVELELDVRNHFVDDDPMAYNTIAEIPGTDKKDEVVMLGAHMDSWHSGTGATDNGTGVAVTMEAVRILEALGVKPRRTIRIGLWSGEEQGLLGSRAYVGQHFAFRPEPRPSGDEAELPSFLRRQQGPLTRKPEWDKLAGYFNIDNGSGRLRGVYLQENAAVLPIFEAWEQPLKDLGFGVLSMRNTGGTDHLSFDSVGLPGFQFIQDPLEYGTRTHHSNMDVYERAQRDDLMQASVILATFVYNAAMRDQMLPRKPLPPDSVQEEPAKQEPAKPADKGKMKKS